MKRIAMIMLAVFVLCLPVTAQAAEISCQHQYEAVLTDPTCTQEGFTTYTCTLCQDTYQADLPAPLGHSLQLQQQIPATCTQEGIAEHYLCDRCQLQFWDAEGKPPVTDEQELLLEKLPHDYTHSQEITPPTCLEGGYTTYYCRCGASVTGEETDPVACAQLEQIPRQEPSCTQEGIQAHYRCGLCGLLYWDAAGTQPVEDAAQLVIPVVPHSYGDWETTLAPTPETGGEQARKCQNCTDTQTQPLPPLEKTLSTPKLTVKVSASTGKPTLSWEKVNNATAYRIYRGTNGEEEYLQTVTALKDTDKSAVPGVKYTYRVIAVNETQCSLASAAKEAVCKCAKVSLSFSRDAKTGKPVVSWEPVEGAVRYQVYRATGSSKDFKTRILTEDSSFLDETASAGKKYYYKIKAICANPEGNSTTSTPVFHVCDCAQPVVRVTSGVTSGIKLTWSKVSGAKRYLVYRADSADGEYTKLISTTSLSYTDTKAPKNQVSYYKVRAYGSDTVSMSAYCEPVFYVNHTFRAWKTVIPNTWESQGRQERTCSVCAEVEAKLTPILKRSLSTPKLSVTTDKNSGKPVLSWKKVTGASKYQVYVYDAATGEKVFLTDTESRSYTYKDAVPGQKYSFTVLAQSSSKCSTFASAKSVTCKTPTPKLYFDREDASGKPIVYWKEVDGAVGYRLYRSTSKTRGFQLYKETAECSVTATDAYPGKTYYYKIQALHENTAANSATSAVVSHVCDCPQVDAPSVRSADPKGLEITWQKVTGGKRYVVYRADAENGTYRKIASIKGLSYVDTSAPKNRVVYYKIRSYGSSTASIGAYSAAGSAMNHTYSRWNVLKASTWQEEGYRERTCSGCGDVDGQTLPKLKRTLSLPKVTAKPHSTSGKPYLYWNKISRATEYWVYLYDPVPQEYTWLDYTDACSYTYKDAVPGKTYTFAVVAIGKTECSAYSLKKSALCRCAKPTLAAGNDVDTGKPVLRWDAVPGAAKYEIYRATRSSGTFKLYRTTEALELRLDSAKVGSTYFYKIRAVHESNAKADSTFSRVKKSICRLPRPVVTGGAFGSKSNTLSWDTVEGAQKYYIYRATSEKGTYKKIETTEKLRFVDYVSAGKTYYYKVVAIGEISDTKSARSVAVSSKNPSPEKVKIFISPSCQKDNIYYKCKTSEATQCRAMGKLVAAALERCGFDVKINVTAKNKEKLMKDSNKWGADLHVPLHTNAHNRRTVGTRIFYNKKGSLGYKASKAIMKTLGPVTPGEPDLLVCNPTLYEIGASRAPTAYIEAEFHDSKKQAQWIIDHKAEIAEAICQGICNFYGVTYVAPETVQS